MPNIREIALVALHEIWRKGRKPKAVLESLSEGIDRRDRAFLMELVYGTLRYRDTIDWVLKGFLKNPAGLGSNTTNNLRLGVYQLLFMRVPSWAAVNEAVAIEKERGKPGVVNGVLRNLLRNLDSTTAGLKRLGEGKSAGDIALSTSHPEWLIKRWIGRFGEEEARGLAEANNMIPPLTLRVNTLKVERGALLRSLSEKGIEGEATSFSPDGIRLKEFHAFGDLPFKDSLIVQDEAAQLISYLLDPQSGERILDACAAPGGKTTHIAQIMGDSGEVAAVESEEVRIEQLRENVSTLGLRSVAIIHADVGDLDSTDYCTSASARCFFDRVLVDAPCSSLGVIRRNPDVKYRHSRGDLLDFGMKQVRILRSAARFLKPGGTLVYSVCSTEPEEGEKVVEEFLKDSEDFYIIDTVPPMMNDFVRNGFFRTYPHKHGMDGFFGVRLCRRA